MELSLELAQKIAGTALASAALVAVAVPLTATPAAASGFDPGRVTVVNETGAPLKLGVTETESVFKHEGSDTKVMTTNPWFGYLKIYTAATEAGLQNSGIYKGHSVGDKYEQRTGEYTLTVTRNNDTGTWLYTIGNFEVVVKMAQKSS